MRLVRRLRYEVCVGSDGSSEVFIVRHLKTGERVGAFCRAHAPPDRFYPVDGAFLRLNTENRKIVSANPLADRNWSVTRFQTLRKAARSTLRRSGKAALFVVFPQDRKHPWPTIALAVAGIVGALAGTVAAVVAGFRAGRVSRPN